MFWKKKTPSPNDAVAACAHSLFQVLVEWMKVGGRVRAEDLITVAASIVGESCIAATGNFDPRKHEFTPGARAFSDKANELFCGDAPAATIDTIQSASIVGLLRDKLLAGGYRKSDFPPLKGIFEHFAANIGKPSDWGKVPLAVPDQNQPVVLPLRAAYEARPLVDRAFQPLGTTEDRLKAAVFTLVEVLIAVRRVIDRQTAVLLALQVINGMAKTAPMTDAAMRTLQQVAAGGEAPTVPPPLP